jgi:hypothetical protein
MKDGEKEKCNFWGITNYDKNMASGSALFIFPPEKNGLTSDYFSLKVEIFIYPIINDEKNDIYNIKIEHFIDKTDDKEYKNFCDKVFKKINEIGIKSSGPLLKLKEKYKQSVFNKFYGDSHLTEDEKFRLYAKMSSDDAPNKKEVEFDIEENFYILDLIKAKNEFFNEFKMLVKEEFVILNRMDFVKSNVNEY